MRQYPPRTACMKPRISVLTLTVENLEQSVAFYRDGLGWPTQGIIGTEYEHGAVAFFDLQQGLKLALWPRTSLAHDSRLQGIATAAAPQMSLGHNVNTQTEVDEAMAKAEQAGAKIIKSAQATFWGGYAGYFQDLDGHLWEVVWNPHLIVQ